MDVVVGGVCGGWHALPYCGASMRRDRSFARIGELGTVDAKRWLVWNRGVVISCN